MDWSDVDVLLRRLKLLLPSRVGPHAAQQMLSSLVGLKERGARAVDVCAAASSMIDAFASREPLCAPFSFAVCRAVADAGAQKLSSLSSKLSFSRRHRGLSDVEASAVADHAAALVPAFRDVDVALGVAWKNALLYRLSLSVGECWSRNDGAPLFALAAAAADLSLDERSVPVGLKRSTTGVVEGTVEGVVVARGHLPPDERAPFVVRQWTWVPFSGDAVVIDRDGGFAGLRALLARWALPITPATLPWLVHVLCMSARDDDDVVVADDAVDACVAGEDALDQERFQGGAGASLRQRMGLPAPPVPSLPQLSLTIGPTRVTYFAGGDLDVR